MIWKFNIDSQKWKSGKYVINGFLDEDGSAKFITKFKTGRGREKEIISRGVRTLQEAQKMSEDHQKAAFGHSVE